MCFALERQSRPMDATDDCVTPNNVTDNDSVEPKDLKESCEENVSTECKPDSPKIEENPSRKTGKIRVRTPPLSPRSCDDEYFKPLKRLCMSSPQSRLQQASGSLRSFSICDILQHEPPKAVSPRIVRPWNSEFDEVSLSPGSSITSGFSEPQDNHQNSSKSNDDNPLDALFQMTSNTFKTLKNVSEHKQSGSYCGRQQSKKKRKSRTAFTNHQIFELEKRFIYQKYLSPADRDELSQTLGLSNAQVITWFQNRRAKLKRDMEELKKDVHSASLLNDHNAFIKTMTQMGLLKTKPGEQYDFRK